MNDKLREFVRGAVDGIIDSAREGYVDTERWTAVITDRSLREAERYYGELSALRAQVDKLTEKVRNQRREIHLITRQMTNEWGVQLDDLGSIDLYDSEQEAVDAAELHGGEVVHRWTTTWEPQDMVLRKCPGCPARARDLGDPHVHNFDCSWYHPRRERSQWPTPTR